MTVCIIHNADLQKLEEIAVGNFIQLSLLSLKSFLDNLYKVKFITMSKCLGKV